MKIMEKIKNEQKISNALPISIKLNMDDVKMTP